MTCLLFLPNFSMAERHAIHPKKKKKKVPSLSCTTWRKYRAFVTTSASSSPPPPPSSMQSENSELLVTVQAMRSEISDGAVMSRESGHHTDRNIQGKGLFHADDRSGRWLETGSLHGSGLHRHVLGACRGSMHHDSEVHRSIYCSISIAESKRP